MCFLEVLIDFVQALQNNVLLTIYGDQSWDDPLVPAIVVEREFRLLDLSLKFFEFFRQKSAGIFTRLRVEFNASANELLRVRIGQARRELRVGGRDANARHSRILD